VILGEIRQPASLVHLTPHLQHKDIRVRRETIRAMTKIGGQRAINILLQATTSNDQELRRQALLSLGAIRASSAVPTLLKIAKRPGWSRNNVDLKKDAIRSLGEIRSNDAVPILERIVSVRRLFHRNRFDELRVSAAAALGEIGDESARDTLEKATHDKSATVARAAKQALNQLDKGIS
jgi:HEAT repeat protein